MSPRSEVGASPGEAFAVCLDCGKRFAYNLKEMRFNNAKDSGGGPEEPLGDQ
jgi:hypothetical protein